MEPERIESIIESLLFVAGEPLSLKRMGDVISGADRAELKQALAAVVKRLAGPERGLRVVEVAGGYQLQTDPENAAWVARLLQSRPVRLSRASLETLAIVAYKQPTTRAEVEDVRGVDCGGVLKTLLDHGFVRIAGRKDVPGKPLIYATDKRFMEFFRLKSLAELPTLKELADIQDERIAQDDGLAEQPGEEAPGDEGGPEVPESDENAQAEEFRENDSPESEAVPGPESSKKANDED